MTPHTLPVLVTVATRVLALLQAPPVAASVNDVEEPAHTMAVPLMVPAAGKAFAVTIWVAAVVPQEFVTV